MPSNELPFEELKKLIQKTNVFDKKYYLKRYKDARASSETAINHFCKIGIQEHRDPNKDFDTLWYKTEYHNIEKEFAYPLVHFLLYGKKENRFMNATEKKEYEEELAKGFDVEFYINSHDDLKAIESDEYDFLLHYIRFGRDEERTFRYGVASEEVEAKQPINQSFPKTRVLFVTNTGRVERPYLDPSVRYRCYNAATGINKKKFLIDIISFEKFTLEHIALYDDYVFHRPPNHEKLFKALELIKTNKKKYFADYDDLIFSPKYALESSLFKTGRASKEQCLEIFNNNKEGMMQFDDFIVSTSTLKKKILELKPNARITIIHNAISDTFVNMQKIKEIGSSYLNTKKKVITYLSGTKSHDADFKIIEDALCKLYEKNRDRMILQVVGPLEYNKEKLHFVKHYQYVPYELLSDIIKKSHINIAPLEINNFTECKSGLKFFESGIFGIPSVVTPIPDMLRFKNSEGICYASNSDEWGNYLDKLINDKSFYQKVSNKTKKYILNNCLMKNEIYKYENLFGEKE